MRAVSTERSVCRDVVRAAQKSLAIPSFSQSP